MSQTEQVYEYIKTHGSIDPLKAIHRLGILRLSARIWDLRAQGVEIETVRKTRKTKAGVKEWAEYRLKESRPADGTAERQEGTVPAGLPS